MIKPELMLKIFPLLISYDSVPNGEWDSDYLKQRLPPTHGLIPGGFGLIAIAWGWWNMRFERYLPVSGVVFLIGCLCWIVAMLIVLPWSVS